MVSETLGVALDIERHRKTERKKMVLVVVVIWREAATPASNKKCTTKKNESNKAHSSYDFLSFLFKHNAIHRRNNQYVPHSSRCLW